MSSDLILIERSMKLYKQIHKPLIRFPRIERYAMQTTIRMNFTEFITNVMIANRVNSLRKTKLQLADANLETLRLMFNLAFDLKYISKGFHSDVMYKLDEIGRLLGGFMKVKTTVPKSEYAGIDVVPC